MRQAYNNLRVLSASLASCLAAVLTMVAGGGLLLGLAIAAVTALVVLIATIPDDRETKNKPMHIVYEVIDETEWKYGR